MVAFKYLVALIPMLAAAVEESEMAQMVSDMMGELDANKDGALQLSEVMVGMEDTDDEEKQEFEAMLKELDTDSNGQLDAPEMPAFLQKMEEMDEQDEGMGEGQEGE